MQPVRPSIWIWVLWFGATPLAGQSILFDGEFVDTDWTHAELFASPTASLGPVTQFPSGGNPDAYQQGEHTVNSFFDTIYSGHTCTGCGSFEPDASGPISSIDVQYDRRDFADPIGSGVETGVMIRQGGQVFIRRMDTSTHASWTTVTTTGLTETDSLWQLINSSGLSAAAPDFSTNGASIEFGYYTRNIVPPVRGVPGGGGFTQEWGIDNFRIGICSPELCNGVDDDCDSAIDEDFTVIGLLDIGTVGELPVGSVCYEGEGLCFRSGRVMCSSDGLSAECVVDPPTPSVEGPVGSPTCCNFEDDDCDGLQDAEDPDCTTNEFCDFCDNDNDGLIDEDFPNLDDACTVGVGICRKGGFYNCTTDGLGTVCSAVPLPPSVEGPPQSARCLDGLDNDCDGLVDINDPDCQEPELCDGFDNDGDTQVDEDFPTLGQACVVGSGQCTAIGQIICTPDGSGTMCSASPGKGSPEGPVGCDCADGIDNDCDGLVDLNDPDCGGSQLAASCALIPTCGPDDNDCRSWHTVDFQTTNGAGNETVVAELLGLDTNGTVLFTIPVEQGDAVRLASRTNAVDFTASTTEVTLDQAFFDGWAGCETGPNNGPFSAGCEPLDSDCDDDIDFADFAALQIQFGQTVKFHELAAPTPLLHILAADGLRRTEAFCSNVPFADVIEPDHFVSVSQEGENLVRVTAAVPQVDPGSLNLKIDGVDVFSALGLNPANDFPGGPFGGLVQLTPTCSANICELRVEMADVGVLSPNTISMNVENLCCGGHIAVLSGAKRPGSFPDIPDPKCYVDDLSDGGVAEVFEVTMFSPQDNEVTAGGGLTNVTGEVCHGRELECPFPTQCGPMVKLNGLYSALGPPVFTPGDGINSADTYVYPFTASLADTDLVQEVVQGFGAHGTLDPGANRLIAEANDPLGNAAFDNVFFAIGPVHQSGFRGANGIDKGLNLALTPDGLQQTIEPILVDLLGPITQEMRQWLVDLDGEVFPVNVPNTSCDPDIIIDIDQGTINDLNPNQFIYDITPVADQLDITVTAPQASASATLKGGCKIKVCSAIFPNLCWCLIKFTVNVSATAMIDGVAVQVVLTENDILTNADVAPTLLFDASNVDINIAGVDIEAGCIGGFVIALLGLEDEIETILLIIAQHYIDNELDIGQWLNFIDLPAIQMELLELDSVPINAAMLELGFEKTDVQITPDGLAMAFETTFTPTVIDPEVEDIPGTPITDAPLPQPLIPMADNLAIAISDDAINQLFHASTRTGALITAYEDNTKTINDLLPVDCSTLAGEPGQQGACSGLRGDDCALLPAGLAEDTCNQVSALSGVMNINSSTPLLLHGHVDIPAKVLLIDEPATTNTVETALRLSQLSVGIIADRDGDGLFTKPFDTVPPCTPLNPATTEECALWESCLDIDFFTDLSLSMDGNVPVINANVTGSVPSTGTMCSGASMTPGSPFDTLAQSQVVQLLTNLVSNNTPPLRMEGLDFGGVVNLQNPRLIAIENDGNADFDDYLAITADPQ